MRYKLLVILIFSISTCFSQNADIDLLKNINNNRNKKLDNTFKIITNSVGPICYGSPIVVIGTGLIANDSTLKNKGLYMGASIILSSCISNILKYSINRERPYKKYPFIEKLTSGGSPSFPSGHTSDAFTTATSLCLAFPKWYVIVPSFTWAAAVGYSRMHLGVHYPSDVLIGAIIGAGSSYLCYKAQKWFYKKSSK